MARNLPQLGVLVQSGSTRGVPLGGRRRSGGDLAAIWRRAGWQLLDRWRHLAVARYPVFGPLDRVWQLRDSLSTMLPTSRWPRRWAARC